jgi:transcriptional regulator with XRE-family HTH domain
MAEGIDVARLGRLVHRKRRNDRLSLRELAEITDLKIPTLSRIERGASKDIESATLLALSEWLGKDLNELREQKPKSIVRGGKDLEQTPEILDVYLRADKNLNRDTAHALSELFKAAYSMAVKKQQKE